MPSGAQLHILLVEDNPDHAEMILRRMNGARNRFEAEHAATLADGVEALSRRQWDAVLLDLQLPDSRGLETLDRMVRHAADVPVIVLTSLGDDDLATAALQQGAQDYLVKDNFTSEILTRTIGYSIERKRIEERLKRSHAEVAKHAKELEQLNRRLEEQNADLDQFNHMISHDLREPIRHLMLFSQKLRNSAGEGLPEKAGRDLQLVFAAAQRMENSISGLQTLSQASRGDIRRTPVSLDFCLRAAMADLEESFSERGAVVSFEPLPEVEADATLLTLLLRNLISNALKYCPTQPRIHVTAEHNGAQWVFGVRDNGIGIDPRYADRIFEPFQRLHGREEYGGGSGLGLAICQKIVAGHGGRIAVDSKLGEGAHFRFTLCPEANGLAVLDDSSAALA
jgi:signal transduction histidine kinase